MVEGERPKKRHACLVVEDDGEVTTYILIKSLKTAIEYAALIYEVLKKKAGGIERIGAFEITKGKSGVYSWRDQFSDKTIMIMKMPINRGTLEEVVRMEDD